MRIIVTGVRGFIGSVLAKRATELGHTVYGIDDESRGLNDPSFLGENYFKHDCLGGILEVFQGQRPKIDAVAHLAALTGELQRPIDELNLYNVHMMERVYADALTLGAKAFVFPTTSLALGVPDSGYVISKEAALKSLLFRDFEKKIAIPLRFFNVCGSYKGLTEFRKNEVHIVYKVVQAFMEQGLLPPGENKPFLINGSDYDTKDGTPSRDFVNVLDVVEYILRLVENKLTGFDPQPASDGATWLGTGKLTTALDVVNIAEQYLGDLKYTIGPRRSFDCGALHVDPHQRDLFKHARGGMLIPPHISIRDEIRDLVQLWTLM